MIKPSIIKVIVGKTKRARFLRNNATKDRAFGKSKMVCKRCGSRRGHISKYSLHICRRCFREVALEIGFKKLR